tara:strand:- start:52 stop:777 length:726 start_codon:yes stop_codon:yes gene_type:complete
LNKSRKLSKKIERTPGINPDDFDTSCEDLIRLCDALPNLKGRNHQLLKNFIKIRLISVVEFNLKGFVSGLIDDLNLEPKSVLEENEIIIDLDVLQNLKNEEYTKGKIVVAHLDKMNPGILYKIMSRINNLDFFKWIDNIMGQKSGDFYAFYKHLNMERNDMTHNLTDTEDSPKDIKRTIITMKNFIFTSYICTNANIDIFQKNKPESFIERQYSEQFKKLKINSDKFKSITKKFREKYKPS